MTDTVSTPGSLAASAGATPSIDPCGPLQGFLLLDLWIRLFIWSAAFALTCGIFAALDAWPDRPLAGAGLRDGWLWGSRLALWVLIYNVAYVGLLVGFRLPIPMPRSGVYATNRKLKISNSRDRQLIWSCLIAVLTKARYEAPFPAFLVFHISNIPPMRWLMGPIFGPKSKSCYVTEPLILDPHLVEIGRNVVIGSNASIAGHIQVPNMVQIRKTLIEDDCLIGANALIFGGVHIKRGAMVAGGSVVAPYTTIGAYEYWSGVPAVKIRDLSPGDAS